MFRLVAAHRVTPFRAMGGPGVRRLDRPARSCRLGPPSAVTRSRMPVRAEGSRPVDAGQERVRAPLGIRPDQLPDKGHQVARTGAAATAETPARRSRRPRRREGAGSTRIAIRGRGRGGYWTSFHLGLSVGFCRADGGASGPGRVVGVVPAGGTGVAVPAAGRGRRWYGDREVSAAIVFVATSGCTWRQVPPVFGASWQTVYRRFAEWSSARVRARPHRVILDELGAGGELDWSRCAIDSVSVRAAKGGL